MAKGLKMAAARKKDSGHEVFKIGQLCTSDNGSLLCKNCLAEVQYVSAHTRGEGDSQTRVSAYLKLRQNEDHREHCPYSINGAINILVAESQAVEDSPRIFHPDEAGNYLFRMNILVDALKVADETSGTATDHDSSSHALLGRNYVPSGQHLASYFRSASGLARIRALIEEASDIRLFTQCLKIRYRDRDLSWNDFYYDSSRYPILFQHLKNRRISHPVALKLTIKYKAEESKRDVRGERTKTFPWSFQCYGEHKLDNGKKQVFIPRIRFAKEDFPAILFPDNTVLAVGKAWVDKSRDTNSIFKNFSIAVYHNSQICEEVDIQ